MKKLTTIALGALIATGVVTTPFVAPAVAQKKKKEEAGAFKPELSKEFRAPIAAAQQAAQAKDFVTAKAKLDEATPLATLPDEKYMSASSSCRSRRARRTRCCRPLRSRTC